MTFLNTFALLRRATVAQWLALASMLLWTVSLFGPVMGTGRVTHGVGTLLTMAGATVFFLPALIFGGAYGVLANITMLHSNALILRGKAAGMGFFASILLLALSAGYWSMLRNAIREPVSLWGCVAWSLAVALHVVAAVVAPEPATPPLSNQRAGRNKVDGFAMAVGLVVGIVAASVLLHFLFWRGGGIR